MISWEVIFANFIKIYKNKPRPSPYCYSIILLQFLGTTSHFSRGKNWEGKHWHICGGVHYNTCKGVHGVVGYWPIISPFLLPF